MKRMKFTPAALMAAAALVLAASCNKTEDPAPVTQTQKTKKEMLTGTWEVTHTAKDANSDNTLDESEKSTLPAGDYTITTLNADGTGTMKLKQGALDTTFNVNWELRNNDDDFFIKVVGLDSATNSIVTLTDTEFIVWDNTDKPSDPREWSVMKKQ